MAGKKQAVHNMESENKYYLQPGLQKLSDEELAELAQKDPDSGALDFLLVKYKNFVRARARSYFLVGADHEDIVQEGMIGLFKAVRDYKIDKQASFHAFAELCITRQIITAIKTATRQKHQPLNSYVSLNRPLYEEENERTLIDIMMERSVASPEELFLSAEDYKRIENRIETILSPLEQTVLSFYLDGNSYQLIAEKMGRSPKSIDNALQRVKRKLGKCLEEENLAKG